MIGKHSQTESKTQSDRIRQHRRLYAACFLIFLITTLIERVLPGKWRFRQTEFAHRKSIIEEAKEQASRFMPFLYMNY